MEKILQNSTYGYKSENHPLKRDDIINTIKNYSDEEKIMFIEYLMRKQDIEEAKLINDGLNLNFKYKRF
jgi:CRISPR/Cas system-associated endoribonuclease Cas2